MLAGAAIALGVLKQLQLHEVSVESFEWDALFLLYVAALLGALFSEEKGELATFIAAASLATGVGLVTVGLLDLVFWHRDVQKPFFENPGPLGLGALAILIPVVNTWVRSRRRSR